MIFAFRNSLKSIERCPRAFWERRKVWHRKANTIQKVEWKAFAYLGSSKRYVKKNMFSSSWWDFNRLPFVIAVTGLPWVAVKRFCAVLRSLHVW